MYCKKLQSIYQNPDSVKYLIDELVVNKLDYFIKNEITFRERQNINPIKFSNTMNVHYKTSLMTFIIGSRVGLFRTRTFYRCLDCDEQQELFSLSNIKCDCGVHGNYNEFKDQITLYFNLLEKPIPCDEKEDFDNQLALLDDIDIENINDFSLNDVEKVGGSAVLDEIESSLCAYREETIRSYLGE